MKRIARRRNENGETRSEILRIDDEVIYRQLVGSSADRRQNALYIALHARREN